MFLKSHVDIPTLLPQLLLQISSCLLRSELPYLSSSSSVQLSSQLGHPNRCQAQGDTDSIRAGRISQTAMASV